MKCASCGMENESNVNFCKGCGRPLQAAAAEAASTASAAPVVNATPAATAASAATAAPTATAASTTTPATPVQDGSTTPFKRGNKSETVAFVLAIIALVLQFIPIPLLSWFCLPCAVIGFTAAAIEAQCSHRSKEGYSGRIIASFVFSGYVIAISLLSAIGFDGATATGVGNAVGSLLGGDLRGLLEYMF